MRLCRGDAAALLTSLALAACSPDADAVGPAPSRMAPVPFAPAGRVVISGLDDERFYVPAGDTIRRLRVRARDRQGNPFTDVAIEFAHADDRELVGVGSAVTDSLGVASVPPFATGGRIGRRTLSASADGSSVAAFSYLVLPAAFGGPSFRRCPIPPSLLPRYSTLARTTTALTAGDSLRVVAIGSSSTEGIGASSVAANYPSRLQARLRAAYPAVAVTVFNKGIGAQKASDMVARFENDVFAQRPHLVIWQTGTVDATNVSLADYKQVLRTGLGRLQERGIDVLLMDSQAYGSQPAQYDSFQQATADVAAEFGVQVVNRYRLMRAYVASGRYTMSELLYTDSFHPNDLTYDCMAHWILAGILSAQVGAP